MCVRRSHSSRRRGILFFACWLWRQFHDSLRKQRVDASVTVEVPERLHRHAEDMAAMADDPETRFDDVLFNHVRLNVDWQPVEG